MRMIKSFAQMNGRWSGALHDRFPNFFKHPFDHIDELRTRVRESAKRQDIKNLLEIGGIDRPLLEKSSNYVYSGVDIEHREQCYDIYDDFIVQSIEEPLAKRYDIIFSANLLEHVPNNLATFVNIHEALTPRGATFHYLPSKNHPYSICLRIVGPRWQRRLLGYFFPPGSLEIGGYPAFFDHCSPRAMRALLTHCGFRNIEIQCTYRANGYFRFFLPAYVLVSIFENICRRLNLTFFCAGMLISATK